VIGALYVIATILVLLGPVALIYGWVCYFKPKTEEAAGWRGWATIVSLALASLVIVLWPVLMVMMPGSDWRSGVGVAEQWQWVLFWVRTVFRTLLVALILGAIGRRRLIAPIVFGCVGGGLLWLFTSTMD
jgi:hypothetical protein